jgi:hypothetical protein
LFVESNEQFGICPTSNPVMQCFGYKASKSNNRGVHILSSEEKSGIAIFSGTKTIYIFIVNFIS